MKPCDVLIADAWLIDGTGSKRRRTDIAIIGERVAGVGDGRHWQPKTRIDARDRVVAPGFVDAHTHDDRAVLSTPDMTPKISQGVTTVIAGNCGISLSPLAGHDPPAPLNLLGNREWYRFASYEDYAETVEAHPPALNIATLVGHSTLRVGVMDDLARAATPAEIDRMGKLLEQSLAAGCIGMSTGLAYPTAHAAPTDEIAVLAQRLVPYNGVYTTHMRDERDGVV